MYKLPITQRAKCSPLKINETLVAGAGITAKAFTDLSAAFDKEDLEDIEPMSSMGVDDDNEDKE